MKTPDPADVFNTWDQVRGRNTTAIAELRVSPEGQEGLKAFLEKRPPNWISKNAAHRPRPASSPGCAPHRPIPSGGVGSSDHDILAGILF